MDEVHGSRYIHASDGFIKTVSEFFIVSFCNISPGIARGNKQIKRASIFARLFHNRERSWLVSDDIDNFTPKYAMNIIFFL